MTSPLDSALDYANRGWAVLPIHSIEARGCTCGEQSCGRPGKHPRIKPGPRFKDATTEGGVIQSWFRTWPHANVGILTGVRSAVVVLDVDPRNGGEASLAKLVATHGELPATVMSRTGGGGRHYFFSHPGGYVASRSPGAGLDLQADGGHFVVAPPSIHVSGTPYVWAAGLDPASSPLAPLPPWLMKPKSTGRLARKGQVALSAERAARYAEGALRKECGRVAQAKHGQRNNTLYSAAANMGELVGGRWIERDSVEVALRDAAGACGLLEDSGEAGVDATIRSGIERGLQQPRELRGDGLSSTPHQGGSTDQNESEAPTAAPDTFNLTDIGNAERLVLRHGMDLRYCPLWGKWLARADNRWLRDGNSEAERRAKKTVRALLSEAIRMPDGEGRTKMIRWALRSESDQRVRAMLKRATVEPGIEVAPMELDANPWRIAVLNGIVDLKTGKLLPHDRHELNTKLAPVEFDPDARCPLWDAFLERMVPSEELRAFLQRAAGYSLTGSTREEVLFFLHGPTSAGKSTYIEAQRLRRTSRLS